MPNLLHALTLSDLPTSPCQIDLHHLAIYLDLHLAVASYPTTDHYFISLQPSTVVAPLFLHLHQFTSARVDSTNTKLHRLGRVMVEVAVGSLAVAVVFPVET